MPRRLASTETKMGDIVYQDINGDGKIDGEDMVRYGMPSAPHFSYGVDFALSYKGFSVSGLFYGTGKRNMAFGVNDRKDESMYVMNDYQLDYWRDDNRDAIFPRKSLSSNVNGNNNQESSSFWVKNAAFLRLKNLSFAYDFKYKLLENIDWLTMCKVSVVGTNLFTISGVSKFFDPEASNTNGGYPVQRVYSVGVTLGF